MLAPMEDKRSSGLFLVFVGTKHLSYLSYFLVKGEITIPNTNDTITYCIILVAILTTPAIILAAVELGLVGEVMASTNRQQPHEPRELVATINLRVD
jgi:hypothetical protein